MCTGFTTVGICMNTMCGGPLVNHLRAVADACHSVHIFMDFDCVLTYIFGFHHKQCASNLNDFAIVKFTSQLFSSADDSLKDETPLLLL